jgi:hypothetical protein
VAPACNLTYLGDSGWRSTVAFNISPYLPHVCCWENCRVTLVQQLCEVFWLQDHSEVTCTCQNWEMVRGWLGICSAGWRDCWIQKQWWFWLGPVWWVPETAPWSHCWALGLLLPGRWQWTGGLGPSPMSLWGNFMTAHCPAGSFCLQIPSWPTEVAGDTK